MIDNYIFILNISMENLMKWTKRHKKFVSKLSIKTRWFETDKSINYQYSKNLQICIEKRHLQTT